jgi:hypothetical protein
MERLLDGLPVDGLERVLALGRDEFRLAAWSGSRAGKPTTKAPGAPGEDTDGAFAHGGWSMPYFDPILLDGGKRLFPDDGAARALALVSATTTPTGVLRNGLVAPVVLTMLASRSRAQGMAR